ncbi:Cation/H(+) antiporter [Thalictrum thalictroides]|uniref:Cation/H(+) antiporter n=1 Tax=Thalictrum thalictroides TaxID=46969 RepID=A0A7J6XBY7_THATH|nr:Cation/H(+) antiporter [Thalictrum thalictroides]
MLIQTGASAPLVRYLFKNSMKYILHNKRTIQHLKPNTEFRVLGCVYNEENVPSMVHLLKAINPTKETPIYFNIIHFVELVGRATPHLISHTVHRQLPAAAAVSKQIVNVFKRYEENNKDSITINPYTVVSHYPSMHNNVCMLALNKRTTLIILPYHKNLATGCIDSGIKTVNCGVLENSPCSVAILIDRGLLGGIRFVFTNWVVYHVVVVFLGGADDREALSHGKRMSENPTIVLTVIRFLLTTKENDSDPTERSHDDAMVCDFKFETKSNNRVTYMEEAVEDGLGVIKVFESMEDKYELIILGRRHDEKLPLIVQLTEWNRCSELGTIGDIFTTSGYGGKATLLVVQQQSKRAALSQSCQDIKSQTIYDVER